MIIQNIASISNTIVELFQNHAYEKHVLEMMNLSKIVFPEVYEEVIIQSNGECDFIEKFSQTKYDAKLPFLQKQIQMLTSGQKHAPLIKEWITEMMNEASDYDPLAIRDNPSYNIASTKLYQIIKNAIEKDKPDENIIFFLPYPIVMSIDDSIFLQFAGNYLSAIYDRLKDDIDLINRKIYIIYPSS